MAAQHFYIGTQGDGVWRAVLDTASGAVSGLQMAVAIERPTWVERHPLLPVLYAVSEVGNRDARDGRIFALRIDGDGGLDVINSASARGGGPTHLALDPAGTTLFVANFGGGQVSAIPLGPDGALGEGISQCQHSGSGPHRRQGGPHPHGVTLSPDGRFLLAPDMGSDRVMVHAFDPETRLIAGHSEVATPPGSGPRLLSFGKDGQFCYLLSELSAELFVFGWDGALTLIQTLPLDPPDSGGEPSAAVLLLSGDGLHLYASNRQTDAIQTFAIDGVSGRLSPVTGVASGGHKPWGAGLSPDGGWLLVANQASDNVTVFRRDLGSGVLETVAAVEVPMPTSICFP